jgi:heavy metal translocating P-type ATPase
VLIDVQTPSTVHASPAAARWRTLQSLPEARWAALATALFAVGGVAHFAGAPPALYWALYLACYAAGGWEPALAGWRALCARTLDVDLLMVLAAIGAAAVGQIFDGALLIVIFATSGALEAFGTRRTADSVRSLLDLAPPQATRLRPDGGEEFVDTARLAVGDEILVRPGERIGADGRVIDGASDVDQATITGEPLPVVKTVGDEVFAGTGNGTGALRIRVDRPAGETVVARIAVMVREASATKAPTQLFIEKFEQRYSVGVVATTIALFTVPLLLGEALTVALLRAMTFMIVASPCAVVLATMPPLLAAIALAGRHGVLVKSAVVMERLGAATVVAFDKTGTLTEGAPRLAAVHTYPDGPVDADRLLSLAAGAEHPSEHPVAAAIVRAARDAGLAVPPVGGFASVPGRGVSARVEGHLVEVGQPPEPADEIVTRWRERGNTVVEVRVDGLRAGILGLVDRTRPSGVDAVAWLTELTGRAPIVLTGDSDRNAVRLGVEVGIVDVRAGLLPADKLAEVRGLQDRGERVLAVGDGVNDAPALAAAHTSVAIGGTGSDLALRSADTVLVRHDLTAVPAVVALSRRARRLVTANLAIAATCIVALSIWDIVGHLPLPLAVAGHEGSTVLVALNGLRLLRSRAWPAGPRQRGRGD